MKFQMTIKNLIEDPYKHFSSRLKELQKVKKNQYCYEFVRRQNNKLMYDRHGGNGKK